jgi:dTDP-3-amino-2,3,6-trideoxy-4-keto-D-glucose/dTDP-3-amino-3,4,6-trideoxy-alpha-D-glucose/dTDP-2,6-dideoxy-D-kanosamine transaminase
LIYINNLKQHNEAFYAQYMDAIQPFLKSGPYVLGEQVKSFEKTFAEYIGVPFCISVANGTDAIELSLKALGIEKGSEVITAANAGMYSTISILNSGLKPRFVDIQQDGYNLDIQKTLSAVNKNTKAVIFTHLYGRGTDLTFLKTELSKQGVFLIEDCAQSHGVKFSKTKAGSFGDISTFSFYPTKNLGALGDGGAIVTKNKDLYERVLRLRQYGWDKKYFVKDTVGRNSRLDELQAIFLNIKLPHLDKFNSARLDIANSYQNQISNKKINIRKFENDGSFVAHLFVIEVQQANQRNELISYLAENGIGSDVHYPVPDYLQNPLKNEYISTKLEITEDRCQKILTIPCFPELEKDNVSFIIEKINKW